MCGGQNCGVRVLAGEGVRLHAVVVERAGLSPRWPLVRHRRGDHTADVGRATNELGPSLVTRQVGSNHQLHRLDRLEAWTVESAILLSVRLVGDGTGRGWRRDNVVCMGGEAGCVAAVDETDCGVNHVL